MSSWLQTSRIFAGWLLAWYGVVFALGTFQRLHNILLPKGLSPAFLLSPILLLGVCAAFLFLLLTTLHQTFFQNKKTSGGIFLLILGILLFWIFIGAL